MPKWTEEKRSLLRELWATKMPIADFAHHFDGRSAATIEKYGSTILGLPRRRTDRDWKPEEDAIVREIWFEPGSLKKHSARLPGRTVDGIKARGARLGLPTDRGDLKRSRFSWVRTQVTAALELTGPASAVDLARTVGASTKHIGAILEEGHKAGEFHIADFGRRSTHGQWAPIWALGEGEDAIRPTPRTKREISRKCAAKKRIRAGLINPFRVAAGLVVAPAHPTGRVFQQPMTVGGDDSTPA